MNKTEAIQAMKDGHKVAHRHFSNNEWMKSNPSGTVYFFEDGVQCPPAEFWKWRTDKSYETDWEIIK